MTADTPNNGFTPGRIFLEALRPGEDLLTAIETLCAREAIKTATFTVWGALSSFTLGWYDPSQQVYATSHEKRNMQIASCAGTVSLVEEKPSAAASCVLADEEGQVFGGQLFSESIISAAELALQEITGPPVIRSYDENTGLLLWIDQQPDINSRR